MFGRRKGNDKGPKANQLSHAAKPNTLSWTSGDASEESQDAELVEELESDEVDASFADDDDLDTEEEVDIARRQEELQAELARQAEEFGLANQDATSAFGENGEAVAAVLDRLDEMDIETAEQLADAWMAGDPAERDVVEREMRRKHREGRHSYELSAAEGAVATWLNGRLAAEPGDADLWRIVAEAARGAVDGLILDEDLDDADYDTLYGAWSEIMDSDEEGAEDAEASDGAQAAGKPAAADAIRANSVPTPSWSARSW